MEFAKWVFLEFIPFGDLVSDVALVLTLAGSNDADSPSDADDRLYRRMQWLLWIGTAISAVPEIALFVGVSTGVGVGAILGPATFCTNGKGRDVLIGNARATKSCLRYTLSGGNVITRFLLHFTHDLPS
eukprot:g11655.t1